MASFVLPPSGSRLRWPPLRSRPPFSGATFLCFGPRMPSSATTPVPATSGWRRRPPVPLVSRWASSVLLSGSSPSTVPALSGSATGRTPSRWIGTLIYYLGFLLHKMAYFHINFIRWSNVAIYLFVLPFCFRFLPSIIYFYFRITADTPFISCIKKKSFNLYLLFSA